MAFARPEPALIEARIFGRARQVGLRSIALPRSASERLPDGIPMPPPLAIALRKDLASYRWFGGVARLMGVALPALSCWLTLVAFEAAPLLPSAEAIRPPIVGGATGRHFAASKLVLRLDSVPERAVVALTATLGEKDDLAHMLQRLGLATRDADAVNTLAGPLGPLVPGTHFAVTLGPRPATSGPRPLATLSFRPRFDLDVMIARNGGRLTLVKRPIPVDTSPLHLVGTVGASLYRAARDAGAAPATVQAYLQAIYRYLPFDAIAAGDQFELVVSHKRALDGPNSTAGQDGDLLYAGVRRDGKPLLQVMRWGNDGNFYTAQALVAAAGQGSSLMAPVAGNITSRFGLRRHPILGVVRLHAGIDFAAAFGSPIHAVSDGVVSYAGWHGGTGNYVRIAHGGGIDTGYGHMSRIAVNIGSRVARGAVIGYVGSTGLSTGPHLHYELFRGGRPVDPLSMRFVPHHAAVSPTEVAGFQAHMRQLLALPKLG